MAHLLHLVATDQRRGAETFAVELGDALRDRGHRVDVLAVSPSADGPHLPVRVAGRRRWDMAGLRRIARAAARSELVIGFGSSSLQAGALAATLARRPFVYRNIGDPSAWQEVRWSHLRVGLPLRRAAAVVAVFPAARSELVQRYGVDPEQVRVIPRGVPAGRFPVVAPEERESARRRLGLDSSRPWAVFLGALSAEKDPLTAADAVLATDHVGLILCGDGPLRAQLDERARLAAGRLVVLGPVDDVRPALQAADVLLLTSHTEGVPGAAVEAGLCGLPVVASAVGGVPSLVRDGSTGILVRPGDTEGFVAALNQAVRRRDQLGAAAAEHCRRRFSMDSVADRWEALVSDVLRSPSGRRPRAQQPNARS